MSSDQAAYDLEARLASTAPGERRRRGVFYTPPEVAAAIVRRVDTVLKAQWKLPLGLADARNWREYGLQLSTGRAFAHLPVVNVLEPSAGSGIFLAAVVRQMHRNLYEQARRQGKAESAARADWQRFFHEQLPLQLTGIELMPVAIEAARTTLAQVAEETGLTPQDAGCVPILCANALQREAHAKLSRPATVIVGNPPYSAASMNTSTWIRELLRGRVDGHQEFRSYYHAEEEQPLRERKLWLHDDYVKFLRVAQWHTERAGFGVIGFITNRGFLDNVTFRGLRYQLLHQFDQIEILDINGGGKNRGAAARLSRDESVFDVGQGVAISLLSQSPPGRAAPSSVRFGALWGRRARKLVELAEKPWADLITQKLSPAAPHFFLVPHKAELRDEYAQGIPITSLFPHHTSTIVTARDALVIDADRQRLLARIAQFRDTRLSDQQLREQYFPRPRSGNYLAGDTRGWKLAVAREQLRADEQWRQHVVPCTYRPFDRRWIYWSSTMIDWPRGEVMREMTQPGAVGLIVRRQMPPDRPCTFFFASSALTIDGILRSDNRGNETLIPQRVGGQDNLRRDVLPEMVRREPVESIFAYVYALLHCGLYREYFAEHLRLDFPRLFFPREKSTWQELARFGQRLLDLHLDDLPTKDGDDAVPSFGETVAAGHPKWRDGRVWIARKTPIADASEADWLFQIGGHQVLRKWLKDRRHTALDAADINRYRQIVHVVHETRGTMAEIDETIKKLGGLHRALLVEPICLSNEAAVREKDG